MTMRWTAGLFWEKELAEKKCLLVKQPLILGYKNRQVMAGDKLCAMISSALNFSFLLSLTAKKVLHWPMLKQKKIL